MVKLRFWMPALVGVSLIALGNSAKAEAPGIYYSWRDIDADVIGCIDRATAALNTQALENIQVEVNSISGSNEDATAVFVCLEDTDSTTVMIMVSSTDDDRAFELRESLKDVF
ncbi:MAG: hypothetical protein ACFBSF_03940 [Leptolyngbyaceae cyanobacterium]